MPCGSADASCGQGLFHQNEHDVAIGVNVLFLNSGYVECDWGTDECSSDEDEAPEGMFT